LQEAILQHADPPRVQPIETANGCHVLLEIDRGCCGHRSAAPECDIVNKIIDFVK
jgi:hypothetical protein